MLAFVGGCGGSSGGGERESVGTVSSLASPVFVRSPADPDGILLAGPPSDPALGAIGWMAPSPADATRITAKGILLDRLLAIVDPSASIEAVNATLVGQAAAILSMSGGSPALVLRIPFAADEAAVRVIADALVATEAFIYAQPMRGSRIPPTVSAAVPFSANEAWHWSELNLWPAWNLGEGFFPGDDLRIFNADFFDSLNLTPGTNQMLFLSNEGNLTPAANQGLHGMSLIAGAIDSVAPGVAPDRAVLVTSIPVGYTSAIEVMQEIAWQIGDNELDHFILRTAWNYLAVDEEFDLFSRGERALDALVWRIITETTPGLRDPEILHIVPAGENVSDDPEAGLYQTPWAVSRNFPNLLTFAAQGGEAEAAIVRPFWTVYASSNPAVTAASDDIYTIGAHDPLGLPILNSPTNADFFLPGELIPGACLINCNSAGIVARSGTNVASSLAAGAAAFIWSIDSELTPEQVAVILATSTNGDRPIDVYRALLNVDRAVDVVNAPARMRLLDVAGSTLGSIIPNGVFDDVDLETYLEFFESFKTQRETNGVAVDHSRFDLNANGYTGGDQAELAFSPFGQFDLDVDYESETDVAVQMILGSEVRFEEATVTDAEILCYYGYSELYSGNEDRRNELLASACRRLDIDFDFPNEIDLGVPTELTILAGEAQGVDDLVGEEGIFLEVSVVGGSASPSSGMTDANGLFLTNITAALGGQIQIEIRATATDGRTALVQFEVNADSSQLTLTINDPVLPLPGSGPTVVPIAGTLRDEFGLPIAGGTVDGLVQFPGVAFPSAFRVTTEADGSFSFDLETNLAGELLVRVSASGAGSVEQSIFVEPQQALSIQGLIRVVVDSSRLDCMYSPPPPNSAASAAERTVDCSNGSRSLSARVEFDEPEVIYSNNRVVSITMSARAEAEWSNLFQSERLFLGLELRGSFYQIDEGTINAEFVVEGSPPPTAAFWRLDAAGGLPPSGSISVGVGPQRVVDFQVTDGGLFDTFTPELLTGSGSLQRSIRLTLTVGP